MKTISKYFIIIFALLVSLQAYSQEGDAIFNKVIHEYTLNTNGSSEYREYKEVKLLSHMSFNRLYGETFVVFDPEFQELQINEAYTIMADGKKVVVPDNAFNEVLPRAASHAAPYNKLREMVITHTGLEVGATIYLDYTLKTKAGFVPTFMGEELIKDIVPVKEKIIKIHVPVEYELQYKVLNLRTSPEMSLLLNTKVYTFSFRELSAYTREWGVDNTTMPRLFFSAAKDFDRAYFPFVAQKAFTFPANADMVKAVEKIQEEKSEDLLVALAIQKLVVEDIATWNIPMENIGFKCRTPEEVWKSNGGTPLEKTVLLATLLMKANLSGQVMAIIPQKYFDREVGSLFIFKDYAVMAKVGMGDRIFLSATHTSNQSLAYSEGGNLFLLLDGAVESLRTFEAIKETAMIIYHGNYSYEKNDQLSGSLDVSLKGAVNPFFKLSQDTAYAKRYAGGTEKVELKNLSQRGSQFVLDIKKDKPYKTYGDYTFIPLPESPTGISSWGFSYIETGRQAPIKLRELIKEQYHFEITLPDGYELVSPAVDYIINNDIGTFKIILRQEGNVVYSQREIELKKDIIQFSEFEAFNEIWKQWMKPTLKQVVVKKL